MLTPAKYVTIITSARIVGRQPESEIWVLSPELQISWDGKPISRESAPCYWIPLDIAERSKVKVNIPSRDLCPDGRIPLCDDPRPSLHRLLSLLRVCLKHNFPSALLVLGATLNTFHCEKVIQLFRGCPICVCIGPPETGKTTAILAGLSLCGCSDSAYYVKGSSFNDLQSAHCHMELMTPRIHLAQTKLTDLICRS